MCNLPRCQDEVGIFICYFHSKFNFYNIDNLMVLISKDYITLFRLSIDLLTLSNHNICVHYWGYAEDNEWQNGHVDSCGQHPLVKTMLLVYGIILQQIFTAHHQSTHVIMHMVRALRAFYRS